MDSHPAQPGSPGPDGAHAAGRVGGAAVGRAGRPDAGLFPGPSPHWRASSLLHVGGRRPAARLLGLAVVGWLLLAAAAVVWEPLARVGAERLFAPALLFAAVPAAYGLAAALRPIRRWGGWGSACLAGGGALALAHAGPAVAPRRLDRPLLDEANRCRSASTPTARTWSPC